jgi:tetratricopeptide (TPR) repeat protein/TolB-like protein
LTELIAGVGMIDVGARRAVPLQMDMVLSIAYQIASGLAAAHAKGIVHRDIKPQNILVDKDNRVKILDFGLAKLLGARTLTQEAFAMGTVQYMSPEQAAGKEIDSRTDIWSLGVVLYQMVSGRLPFSGDYDQAVIYAIVNEEMAPLPEAGPHVPPWLEAVIRRCLAKRRQERYASASELARDLRALDQSKVATKPEGVLKRRLPGRTFWGVLTLLVAGGLGFFVLSSGGGAPLRRLLGLPRLPSALHLAVLPLAASGDVEARSLADGFTAVITDKLTWLEKFHDSLWTVSTRRAFENRGRPAGDLQRMWGCNLFVSGGLGVEKSSLKLKLTVTDASSGHPLGEVKLQGNIANLTLFQDGLTAKLLALMHFPAEASEIIYVNTGGTSMPGAYMLYLKGLGALQGGCKDGNADRSIPYLEKALQQDSHYLLARLALLDAWRYKSEQKRDPEWLRLARSQWPVIQQAARRWAPAWLAWGLLLKQNGLEEEARSAFQSALDLDGRCYEAQVQLAKASLEAGAITEAEKRFKKAILLRPDFPKAYEELAYFYHLNGRFDEAIALYSRITRMTPGDPQIFCNLGAMHLIKGEKEQAKAMFEKSNTIKPNTNAQSNLALIYYYDGEYRKALPLHEQAARNSNEHYEWGNLADTYRQLPEFKDKAAATYHKAVALAEELLASTPDDPELISSLALYYAHLGEKQKALAAISRARSLSPAFLPGIERAILVYEAVQERVLALAALRDYLERLGGIEDIEREPDLAGLRRDPAYQKIVQSR